MTIIPQEVADKIGGNYAEFAETIFLSRIKAIGVGATLLVGEHAGAVRNFPKAFDKIAYCWLYRTQILKDEAAHLAAGKSIKGSVIQLGNSGLITYDDLKVIVDGNMVIINACVYTMSWHTLFGGNSWLTIFNKDKPTQVICANYMEGQGKIGMAEKVNCFLGVPLMLRAHTDFDVWLDAATMDRSVEDVLKTKPVEFQKSYKRARSWLEVFDKGGIVLATYRMILGGNEQFDQFNTLVLAYPDDAALVDDLAGKFPEDVVKDGKSHQFSSTEPGGMMVDGFRFNPIAYLMPGVPMELLGPLTNTGLSEKQLSIARTKTQHALGLFFTSEENRQAFREALITITKELQADAIAREPALAKLSPRELLEYIKKDTLYIMHARSAVRKLVLDSPGFKSQITTELRSDPSFQDVNVYDLDLVLASLDNVEVHDRIFAEEGVADAYVKGELVSSGVSLMTSAECVAMVSQCKADLESQTKLVEGAKKARDVIDPSKEKDVEEAQRRVDELQEKVETLKKNQESYESIENERADAQGAKEKKREKEKSKEKELARLAKP
jgi:hypothetical protein